MIDPRLLRDEPDRVRRSQRTRGEDEALVDAALDAEARRRAAVQTASDLRAEQKSLGRGVGAAQGEERAKLLHTLGELAARVKQAEQDEVEAEAALQQAMRRIGNLADDAPPGGEDDFVVVREVGTLPAFDFEPRDHLELGQLLGAIDNERGAKVSGARFYFLTGVGAQLHLALVSMAMSQAMASGFVPVVAPALVKPEAMDGTGFLGSHGDEVYRVERDDLYLVGTSEVPLAAMHADEVLDLGAEPQPRRYVGYSSCFRREAGSYGKDTRGIWRVHWFDKVEMFSFCPPEQSAAEHLRLLAWEEQMIQALELPYRVVDIAGGDLGSSAARKFDCEAWIPTQQAYKEITSTSNCTDFQARRLNVRLRGADGKPHVLHTLNGTLVAVTRWIVALLENHQQADGSVRVPGALQPFLGLEVLEPRG